MEAWFGQYSEEDKASECAILRMNRSPEVAFPQVFLDYDADSGIDSNSSPTHLWTDRSP
jgi:hypothetical protein